MSDEERADLPQPIAAPEIQRLTSFLAPGKPEKEGLYWLFIEGSKRPILCNVMLLPTGESRRLMMQRAVLWSKGDSVTCIGVVNRVLRVKVMKPYQTEQSYMWMG